MKARYGKLLKDCVTREDVNFVLGELIAELNASHAYRGGGDQEVPARLGVGLLGADFALENGAFRIKTILRGADWDAQVRGPLAQPGLKVKEGDYLLAVNRSPLDIHTDPWAAFQGLAGKTVLLTVNDKPSLEGARDVLVDTVANDYQLRYWAWIEANRRYVEKASHGRVGYVYVPDTGIGGQNDLVRQFRGQWDKAGLIIDERFNSGGQIPDRFIEMLGRNDPQLLGRARRQGLAVAPDRPHWPHGHAHQRLERLRRRPASPTTSARPASAPSSAAAPGAGSSASAAPPPSSTAAT